VGGDAEQERSTYSAMSGRRKAGDEEGTVMMVHSLEDSLAHWCTIDAGDGFEARRSAGHQ